MAVIRQRRACDADETEYSTNEKENQVKTRIQLDLHLHIEQISARQLLEIYASTADVEAPAGMTLADADLLHQRYHALILRRLSFDENARKRVCAAMMLDAMDDGHRLQSVLQQVGDQTDDELDGKLPLLRAWWSSQPEPLEAGLADHIRVVPAS